MNRHFPKEDMQMANIHEKMLSITNYWGNATQNSKMLPHMCQDGYWQNDKKHQVPVGMRRKGDPCAPDDGNANPCGHYRKQHGDFSKNGHDTLHDIQYLQCLIKMNK